MAHVGQKFTFCQARTFSFLFSSLQIFLCLFSLSYVLYNPDNTLTRSTIYTDAISNVMESYSTYSYKDNNLTRKITYKNAGNDGQWDTVNDIVFEYNDIRYAENGNRIDSVYYSGAGPDGKWFTPDDIRKQLIEFDSSI